MYTKPANSPNMGTRFLVALFVAFVFFLPTNVFAQLSEKGVPASFNVASLEDFVPLKMMPAIDQAELATEDAEDVKNNVPPRFGFPIDVNYSMDNAGAWTTLPDGSRIWRLAIMAPGALSLNLNYSKFYMPKGAKFFVYGANKKHVIGAFTAANNRGTRALPRGFATGLVYSDHVILEYHEPKAVKGLGIVEVAQVIHGYRHIRIPKAYQEQGQTSPEDFGQSGACQVNINCPEGDDWQQEKQGVALMLINGFRTCTGSLVNNTSQNGDLLFLTADHCIGPLDAQGDTDASYFSFMWNYEAPGCTPIDVSAITTNGATLVANNLETDFALFRLTEDPRIAGAQVHFNGWDRTDSPGSNGVGIHHPYGDIMKIATHDTLPVVTNFYSQPNAWFISFDPTPSGYSVTEAGSSGSPLFNSNGHIIGQLYGGSNANCAAPEYDYSIYPMLGRSWNGFEDSPTRRLREWLHPAGGDAPSTLDGAAIPITGAGNDFGEVGTVSITQTSREQWHTVTLLRTYNDPIVVMGPPSYLDARPGVVRVRNLTGNSFECQFAEWDYLPGSHNEESISYMVVEAGSHTLGGGQKLVAGAVSNVTHKWKGLNYGSYFTSTPLVLLQLTTLVDPVVANVRMRNSTKDGFQMRLREQQANNQKHGKETVHYIAIESGSYNSGLPYAGGLTGQTVDERWEGITFPHGGYTGSSPFLAQMQTLKGGKEAAELRHRNLGYQGNFVELFVQEEKSYDEETNHGNEAVGYIAFLRNGLLLGAASKTGAAANPVAYDVLEPDALEPGTAEAQIQLYPNPATNWFEVSYQMPQGGAVRARLMDLQGRLIREKVVQQDGNAGKIRFEVAGLSKGVYLMRLERGDVVDVLKVSVQ